LNLSEAASQCSTRAKRLIFIGLGIEAILGIGIWVGFVWLKYVPAIVAVTCFIAYEVVCLDFRVIQIVRAAMDEMQEYIDQRIEEIESKLD